MKTTAEFRSIARVAFALFCGAGGAAAFQPPAHDLVPDLDVRRPLATNGNTLSAAHEAGVQRLRSHITDLRVGLDVCQPRPNFVARRNGFLASPAAGDGVISKAKLAAVSPADPHRVTKAFLDEYPEVFGHDASALTNAVIKRDAIGRHNGLRTTVWEQQLDGIPIFEAIVQAHVTKRGELVNLASRFIVAPARLAGPRGLRCSSSQAEARAAVSLGATNGFSLALPTRLVWLPRDAATLNLCWEVTVNVKALGETFRLLVDAQTGDILLRRGLTTYLTATYNVFTGDSPSPFSPGWPALNTNQPLTGARTLVAIDALSTNASPEGWLPDWSTETFGNNVDAHADRNADNAADLPRPQCDGNRVFDFPLNLTAPPTNSTEASVVQLFYWCNWMHDRLYELGFDEAAGNFQLNNFGRGGAEGDPVQADGQDGSGFNNANMTTFADGTPPRMQMYLWNGVTPNRDGDLDAEIVLHEYAHGLSWRLVGGGTGIGALQTQGLGEGWSDFYALALLSQPGDDPNGCYALGGYVAHLFGGQPYSYYFGIRRYPYSTDLSKNPLTYGHISQQVYDGSVPRNPTMTSTAQQSPAEVHNLGEVWCVALWEVRARLIARHGFAVGNQLVLQLVTDGLKLSPPDPTFLQARDAIIQADLVNNAGTNRNDLWAAFARRGMGYSATGPASYMTAGAVEAFDNDDALQALPDQGFVASGGSGAAFAPSCQSYTLTNTGPDPLSWVAVHSESWLDVTPASGQLATGATITVTVCLNTAAGALSVGSYTDSLAFSNTLTGAVQARGVIVDVLPATRAYYFPLDTDPGWTKSGTWAFGHPNGLGGGGGGVGGFADPLSGATGTNVYGVNLNGNYTTAVGAQFNLTTTALNLTGKSNCVVQFQRWLNSDDSLFVQAEFYVGTNTASFTRVWANGLAATDNAWRRQYYNIAALADNQPTVYLRWSYRILRTGARPMSGWNIDDVEILASGVPPLIVPRLDIQVSPPGTVWLSWPTNALGFLLQRNADVTTTNWQAVTNLPAVVGTNFQVGLPAQSAAECFRLRSP